MSNKKDMRREDLIVPYMEPASKSDSADITGAFGSTLPMAAIFTRNKMIGWLAVVFSIQSWLAETPESKAKASTPGIFSVGMSLVSVGVAYMPLFMPPTGPNRAMTGSGTEAPAAIPTGTS